MLIELDHEFNLRKPDVQPASGGGLPIVFHKVQRGHDPLAEKSAATRQLREAGALELGASDDEVEEDPRGLAAKAILARERPMVDRDPNTDVDENGEEIDIQ